MDFSIYNDILSYFQGNILLTMAVIAVIIVLAWKEPKFFFGSLFIAFLLIGVFYLISYLSDTGYSFKKELVQEKKLPFYNEKK